MLLNEYEKVCLRYTRITVLLRTNILKTSNEPLPGYVLHFVMGLSSTLGSFMCPGEKIKNPRTPPIKIRVLQLTLRTFHTGGALTRGIAEHVRAPSNGRITHEDMAKDTRTPVPSR